MPTPHDLGLESEVYALQRQADDIGDATFKARAADLYQRLKSMWVPLVEAPFIESDALELGKDMGDRTGEYVLFDPAEGREVDPARAAFLSGDVGAGLSAAAEDISSTAKEEAQAVFDLASAGLAQTQKTVLIFAGAAFAFWLLAKEL